jgi:hypothetical protein
VKGLAEEAIEDRAGRAKVVRSADLSQNLSLPGHHRVEAGGNPEQVESGAFVS